MQRVRQFQCNQLEAPGIDPGTISFWHRCRIVLYRTVQDSILQNSSGYIIKVMDSIGEHGTKQKSVGQAGQCRPI
jgi:hypothetical protein